MGKFSSSIALAKQNPIYEACTSTNWQLVEPDGKFALECKSHSTLGLVIFQYWPNGSYAKFHLNSSVTNSGDLPDDLLV